MIPGVAALTSLAVAVGLMPRYIDKVKQLQWGQQIREEGPKDHQSKKGTPTMGGLVIVVGLVVGSLWAIGSPDVMVLLGCTLATGLIGFLDDFAKVRKQRSLGLSSRQKLAAQLLVGVLFAVYMIATHASGRLVNVPGMGNLNSPLLAGALVIAVLLATTNAVNLTDGLDGLAAGTVFAALAAYTWITYASGRADLAVASAATAGACLGFLYFNRFPARIFMGDTGSMALGGVLASLAILTRTEWLLLVIGAVFVMETLSVILQVSYFKATHGKRIFRMSPIHHHFCLAGTHESRVTAAFWTAGLVMAAVGVTLFTLLRATWPPI
ncbi:MAG: phospho-N-acetylmuramoyl-pentapeptide-transferase [Candidatus Xenobia bacterium]